MYQLGLDSAKHNEFVCNWKIDDLFITVHAAADLKGKFDQRESFLKEGGKL